MTPGSDSAVSAAVDETRFPRPAPAARRTVIRRRWSRSPAVFSLPRERASVMPERLPRPDETARWPCLRAQDRQSRQLPCRQPIGPSAARTTRSTVCWLALIFIQAPPRRRRQCVEFKTFATGLPGRQRSIASEETPALCASAGSRSAAVRYSSRQYAVPSSHGRVEYG